jgi:hypothetical protein
MKKSVYISLFTVLFSSCITTKVYTVNGKTFYDHKEAIAETIRSFTLELREITPLDKPIAGKLLLIMPSPDYMYNKENGSLFLSEFDLVGLKWYEYAIKNRNIFSSVEARTASIETGDNEYELCPVNYDYLILFATDKYKTMIRRKGSKGTIILNDVPNLKENILRLEEIIIEQEKSKK